MGEYTLSMKNIKTGADKLVDLVSEEGSVKSRAAAKELGVSEDTIYEWAEFLEQEGRISLKYGFLGMTLHKAQGTKEEAIEAGKKLVSEKDAFRRKIDATINKLEQENSGFEDIKKQYRKIHKQVKNEIDSVKKDVEELQKFEKLKQNIDKEIESQKETYVKESDKLKNQLKQDKKKYDDLNSSISKKTDHLEKERKELEILKEKQQQLKTYLNKGKELMSNIESELSEKEKQLSKKEKEIKETKDEYKNLSDTISQERNKSINSLNTWIDKERTRIKNEQDALLKEAKQKTKEIENHSGKGEKLFKTFEGYFDKKIKVEKYIETIESETKLLRQNLEQLKKKLKTFHSLKTNKELKQFEKDIQKEFDKYDSERTRITQKIDSLIKLIKG